MTNKEILLVVEVVSNEKDIDKETIFQAIESALEAATVKRYGKEVNIRVSVDRKTGDYESFRRWQVVDPNEEDSETPLLCTDTEILLDEAKQTDPDIDVSSYVEEKIESIAFGRIAAQAAKQVIVQRVREAERLKIVEAYKDRTGELVTGVVKRIERGNVYLDLGGNAEAFISKDDMIPREAVRIGDRIRGYLKSVQSEARGPQLLVSRTSPEFLIALFRLEVPEVGEGLIEVLEAARDPGSRAKIAVKSNDPRLDPVGACVGMRGSRVQAVSNELAGERVDIILWNDTPAQYVINAMSPAEIVSIVVEEDSHAMVVAVANDNLSLAIGKGGQNVRLASELTGWNLNVMDEALAYEKHETEIKASMESFMQDLDVDDDVAAILVQEGFSSVEELAYVPTKELMEIEEFDEQLVEELRSRAKDSLLIKAITSEEELETASPGKDLLSMAGMNNELAFALASRGLTSMEDLAELSVDELCEIQVMSEDQAGNLIMTAREPWFSDDNPGDSNEDLKNE